MSLRQFQFSWLNSVSYLQQRNLWHQGWRVLWSGVSGIGIIGLMTITPAKAAENLVVTYGPLSATLDIDDMETLVDTHEAPDGLKFYLNLASLDPEVLRTVLAMEIGASGRFMQGMLASESGNHLLTQMSEVIHLPPDRPNIQMLKTDEQSEAPTDTKNVAALREALVHSAHDRQVTVLEILQNYPTDRVYVNAGKLIRFMETIQDQE